VQVPVSESLCMYVCVCIFIWLCVLLMSIGLFLYFDRRRRDSVTLPVLGLAACVMGHNVSMHFGNSVPASRSLTLDAHTRRAMVTMSQSSSITVIVASMRAVFVLNL
jgi:hypothetical protein